MLARRFPLPFGIISLLLSLFLTVPCIADTRNWDKDWRFHRVDTKEVPGPSSLAAGDWERVDLPHTARIEPRLAWDAWQGTAFYEKRFASDRQWRGQTVLVRFEAVMNVATVTLNGKILTTHLGGYLPFTVDLTPALKSSGENVLVVRINNEDNRITGPKPLRKLDFIMYGGIYRGVSLIVKPPVHITDETLSETVASGGVFVTYPHADAKSARVAVRTELANASGQARKVMLVQILSRNGLKTTQTRKSVVLKAHSFLTVAQDIPVANPDLWSPGEPNLYNLETRVEDGTRSDSLSQCIGIRRFRFEGRSLFINDKPIVLRGVNRHQEYPYVGYAVPDNAQYRDALLIKQAGFDNVRLSHYPQSPAFMAAADELGLLLLDSIPGWQFYNPDPAFSAQAVRTCADMIRRDRNHASVIAWECSLNETNMPQVLIDAFHATVHTEYPGDQAFSAGWMPQTYDIYLQARQHRLGHPETVTKPLIVSEYGDWEYYAQNAGFNQTDWANLKPEARTSRQLLESGEARLRQQVANIAEAHNDNHTTGAIADGYWVMFDYNRGYAQDLESSGVMSLERLPKFAFQFFRSQRDASEASPKWGGGAMVFIASYWQPDSSALVQVYSNADEVELFLNGQSLGRQKSQRDERSQHLAHPPFVFDTGTFKPGTLTATAYIDGKAVATHSVTTAGPPAKVGLSLDTLGVAISNGDVIFARARLIDANGVTSFQSGVAVQFAVSDGYEVIGPDKALSEAGTASVLIRVKNTEKGKLSASIAPGLSKYK